jgi:hypothetical protein
MKKLLLATLLCSALTFQTFTSYEQVEDIVNRITASSGLTAQQAQELTAKLQQYEKDMIESCSQNRGFGMHRSRPAGVGQITPELIDIVTPYVQTNDPLVMGWLCECANLPAPYFELALYIMEQGLVEHTNFVNKDGVPIWHQVLDGSWKPEALDFLLDNGADLEARHPVSGDTALLDLAIPKKAGVGSPSSANPYARTLDYNLSECDVWPELRANPKFAENFETNKKNCRYQRKLNDLYRMWYLIERGADIYAVNSKYGSTLADKIRDNLRKPTGYMYPWESRESAWDLEDWLDLRERMIAYKESRRASMGLPTVLQDFLPVPELGEIVGSYAYPRNHPALSEDDGVEKIDQFFASVHAD